VITSLTICGEAIYRLNFKSCFSLILLLPSQSFFDPRHVHANTYCGIFEQFFSTFFAKLKKNLVTLDPRIGICVMTGSTLAIVVFLQIKLIYYGNKQCYIDSLL